MSTTAHEPAAVLTRLQELLCPLLAQAGTKEFRTPAAIPADAELSTLGVTSIDFLEFVLAVEKHFHLEVLDAIAPDDLPGTLRGWQQYVCSRLGEAA